MNSKGKNDKGTRVTRGNACELRLNDTIKMGKNKRVKHGPDKGTRRFVHVITVSRCYEPESSLSISREKYVPPARFGEDFGGYEVDSKIGRGGFEN